jgi:tRNA-splicing ligase RtcB
LDFYEFGRRCAACHTDIHRRLIKAVGGRLKARIENHHNFAWKENFDGEELIVHRKGATPASEGQLGIIPGSMTSKGFIVKGRGNAKHLLLVLGESIQKFCQNSFHKKK